MSLVWQEKAINLLSKNRKYRVLWWGFGPTMLEVLCKEKDFDAKELLEKKSTKKAQVEKQCIELLETWREKKIYWWWPWSKKVKDIELDKKQYQRARNYKKYFFLWRIILSLFTSVLINHFFLKLDNLFLVVYCREAGMLERDQSASLMSHSIAFDFLSLGSRRFDNCLINDDTLENALKLLDLPNLLKDLDNDLEMVKMGEKSKGEHEKHFNQEVNDKFKKLSKKYHPDQVQKRGGSSKDIVRATEMQQGVNLVWKVLKMLHSNFVNNNFLSNQDFKYSTCSKVEVSILSDEERLRSINNKVLIELCWLSRIKREEIIPNLNKFLKLSQSSIQNFLSGDEGNFAQERNQALNYFRRYLSGYSKLVKALRSLQKECQEDSELNCIRFVIDEMLKRNIEQQEMLVKLDELVSEKNQQRYKSHYVHNYKNADRNFVLPFMEYLNIISVCSKIINKHEKGALSRGYDKFCRWLGFQRDPSVEKDSEIVTSSEEIMAIKGKISMNGTLRHDLLHYLVTYYHYNDKKNGESVVRILKDELNIDIKINKKIAEILLVEMIGIYKEHLEKEFQPRRSFSAAYEEVKQFKIDMEEILERFKSNMQKIGEKQKKIEKDMKRIAKQDEAAIKELKEENQSIAKEMKGLREKRENLAKEMEEWLEEGRVSVAKKMEDQLEKGRISVAKKMEERLKEERQGFIKEMRAQIVEELMRKVVENSQEVSASQQQGAWAFDAQSEQPKKPNAQADNDQNVQLISYSRSSSSSSFGDDNSDRQDPSSKLNEVQSISRDHLLHSDNSDISSLQNR